MIRRVIAGLIVVGLAFGIWVLWPREEPSPSPTTTVHAVASSTSTKVATRTTGSSVVESHVVTTVEEAEDILRQLWFGWFEGIYNQDEARIKKVVGTSAMVESAHSAFGSLAFNAAPTVDALIFDSMEILASNEDCLGLWVSGSAPFLVSQDPTVQSVEVLRWTESGWVLVSSWRYKDDLWEADCESALEPLS